MRGFEPAQWRWHGTAFGIYAALSAILLYHGEPLTRAIEGFGEDPLEFLWFLEWWPFAVTHHLNPLHCVLAWQPVGLALLWVASVPLLAFILAPITWLGGPALAYNLASLAGPVLAAFAMYLACLRITRAPAAALVGGYLFGFSAYEMNQELGTLNLSTTLLVPALLMVILARLNDEIGRRTLVFTASAMLICQFLISVEIFAMIFVFGGIAWLFAMLYLPSRRPPLQRLVTDGIATAPLVLVPLSPLLVSMATHLHAIHLPLAWPYFFDADLLSPLIPPPTTWLGGEWFAGISRHFHGGPQEQDGYIGLPLLAIIVMFARRYAGTPCGRFLLMILAVFVLLAFGPRLWVGGRYTPLGLPWGLAMHLPLLGEALPVRFALFSSLVVAIIVALWLAAPGNIVTRRGRYAAAVVACLSLAPRPHPWIALPRSQFFQPGNVQAAIGAGSRLLVLPFAINGPSSFWQEESRYAFVQTGGYLGFPPAAMQHYAAVGELFGNYQGPHFVDDFVYFCTATNTQYVAAGPGTSPALRDVLNGLRWQHRQVDDVVLYTVPAGTASSHG